LQIHFFLACLYFVTVLPSTQSPTVGAAAAAGNRHVMPFKQMVSTHDGRQKVRDLMSINSTGY
jgi:hypothetical protein